VAEQSVKDRVYAAAERISAERNPTVATVREAAGVSNADATRFLKEWRAERDSAGSKIAATPPSITEQALRLAGTVWAEAVHTATAEHAIIEKAWREEKAHKDREINELATDLDTAARTHQEAVKELQTQVEEFNQAARDNAAAAAEASEQLAVAERRHAEEVAGLTSQLAEARATVATLQQTQDALIARIQPAREPKATPSAISQPGGPQEG
jgi:chromosome segregation ATPase